MRSAREANGFGRGVFNGCSVPSVQTTREPAATTSGSRDRREQGLQRAGSGDGVVVHQPQPLGRVAFEGHGHARSEPTGTTRVPWKLDQVDQIAGPSRHLGRVVGRGVVDDDDPCDGGALLGERGEHLAEQVASVVGDDDGDDARAHG